ncbi:MAG TPA: hypothetical protein VNA20_06750 [Frankiaceae bacterium]|nr:hypothetical protein [Frankiaceae bacterium]
MATTARPADAAVAGRLPRHVPLWLRIVGFAALSVLLAVLTWPVESLHGKADLDGSWQQALHMAARDGVDWGSRLQFTWGPLGFLGQPRWAYPATTAAAFAFQLLGRAMLCATVLYALRRRWWLAVPVALAVSFLVRVELPEVLGTLVVVWCLLALGRDRPLPRGAVEAGAAFAVVVLLMKFNSGLVAVGAVALTAVVVAPSFATLLRLVVAGVGTFVACWAGTGNALGDVPAWVHGSVEVARGYSPAMGIEAGPSSDYPLAFGVVAALAVVLLLATWRDRTLRRLAAFVVVAVLVFLKYKHSFVRHDTVHAHELLTAALLLPIGLVRRRRTDYVAVALTAAFAVLLGATAARLYAVSDLAAPRRFAAQAADVALPSRRAALDAEVRAAYRAFRPVDPALVAMVGNRDVHVDPWDTTVAWAHGLRWDPVPVFQSYSAYTPYLDDRNASAVAAPSGPDVILRRVPPPAIDSRAPTFDSPAYQVAVVCHYRLAAERGGWQLLERTANRCGTPVELRAAAVTRGGTVAVPAPRHPDSLVVARFELDLPPDFARRDLLLKAPAVRVELNGVPRRLVPGTAGQPHLLRASPADEDVPRGQFREVRSVRVVSPEMTWRVRFYEVPFRAR